MNAKKAIHHVNTIVQTHVEVTSVHLTAMDLHSIKIDFVQRIVHFFRLFMWGGSNPKLSQFKDFLKFIKLFGISEK